MTGSARNKIITTGCAGALSLALVASSLAITSSRASGAGTALLPKFTGSSETIATYHYGSSRSGDDRQDPSLAGAVLAWHTPGSTIHGDVYAEPLLDKGLVVVATEDDMVYALNASTGTVHWKASVGAPVQPSVLEKAPTLNSQCGDIFPLGITSTPVIQESTGTIFVAAEVQRSGSTAWQGIEHELFAISISSGRVLWHRQIDPPGAGDGSRGTYVIPALQQRSALTLVGSSVYVEYGGLSGDCGAYHGFVVSLPSSGRGVLVTYRTPSSREDAIWATSGAVTDGAGNLFVATGNGANGPGQPFDFGDAVVKLSPALKVLSYFAPTTWAQLSAADLDIGSGGPIILPDGKTLFEIGKPGYASKGSSTLTSLGWLLSTNLGGIGHSEYRGTVCPNKGWVFGADAIATESVNGVRSTLVYVPCSNGTVALLVRTGAHPSFSRLFAATDTANGPPIVAGGLVWAISTGADRGTGPADHLYALNPVTGAVVQDHALASVDPFVTPAAADGEVIVGTTEGVEAFRPR